MNNQQYVQSLGIDEKAQQKCLRAMEKYGSNHWWEPGTSLRTMAYYQIHEDLLLCNDFSRFHEAIELLLGRPVWTHEFGVNADSLKAEAERAWNGYVATQDEKGKAIATGMKALADTLEKRDQR